MIDVKALALKHAEKLKKIKVVALDLDGILTDGKVHYDGAEVGFNRSFNVYDGYGMKLLMKAGLKVGVITGGDSVSVKMRVEQLGLDFLYAGNEDKGGAFLDLLRRYQVSASEVLYMGDELFDIPLLKAAGFGATVPSAGQEVLEVADYVTSRRSGEGCAREVIDMLRWTQGIHPEMKDLVC